MLTNLKFEKKINLIILSFFFMSCINRNELGQVRPNKIRFSIKNCNDNKVFNKIDTLGIYLGKFKRYNNDEYITNAYKFYSQNRIAYFIDINPDKITDLNPKNAIMGYYSTCSNENKIQLAFYHVQSNIFISKKEFVIKNDSLIVITQKSPQSNFRIDKYAKKILTKNELIYKPDW